jgi:hypothetical protein
VDIEPISGDSDEVEGCSGGIEVERTEAAAESRSIDGVGVGIGVADIGEVTLGESRVDCTSAGAESAGRALIFLAADGPLRYLYFDGVSIIE